MTGSISRPNTLSCGPVKPASVRYAVPPGKNLFVRRLHVRVRAHHRAHLPVQKPRERNLLRGRLGVKIHEDDFRLLAQPFHFVGGEQKRIFQRRLHERAALHIQNADGNRTLDFGVWTLDFKHCRSPAPACRADN